MEELKVWDELREEEVEEEELENMGLVLPTGVLCIERVTMKQRFRQVNGKTKKNKLEF
jgi:hypothetical protein